MTSLILVEKVNPELGSFVKNHKKNSVFFLLTPDAVDFFKDIKADVLYPEDVIEAEQLNLIGEENEHRVRSFVTVIDKYLWEKFPVFKRHNLRFAYYHVDKFKSIFDTIISRLMILNAAVKRVNPSKVYYKKNEPKEINPTLYFKNESVYSMLVPLFCRHNNIEYAEYPFSVRETGFIKTRNYLKQGLVAWKDFLRDFKYIYYYFFEKKLKILMLVGGYDQSRIALSKGVLKNFEVWLWENKFAPLRCINAFKKRRYFSVNNDILREASFDLRFLSVRLGKFCKSLELEWFSLIEDRLVYFLKDIVPKNYTLHFKIKKMIEKIRPDIVLANLGVQNAEDGVILKAVRDLSIPLVMIQHGGGGYGLIKVPSASRRDFEQVPNSHYIMWGKGVTDYFKESSVKYRVKTYPLGSDIIRGIYKASLANKRKLKTIYYIIQNFRDNVNIYYPGGGGHYTDTWYFKLHLKVIEIFKKHKLYNIVLKVPPQFEKISLYEKLIKNNNHIIIQKSPLQKIIHFADFFIVDSLSTSIVQCVATNKPVVVYAGNHCKKPVYNAVVNLEKRAMCCGNEKEFLKIIDLVLSNPDKYKADVFNRDFIGLYGIGNSSESPNWPDVLKKIINK